MLSNVPESREARGEGEGVGEGEYYGKDIATIRISTSLKGLVR